MTSRFSSFSLRPYWQAATRAFEGKSSRERMLMLSALLALLYFLLDVAVLAPQHRRIRQWQTMADVNRAETQRVQKQVAEWYEKRRAHFAWVKMERKWTILFIPVQVDFVNQEFQVIKES